MHSPAEIDAFAAAINGRFNPVRRESSDSPSPAVAASVEHICINCGRKIDDVTQVRCSDLITCDERAANKF